MRALAIAVLLVAGCAAPSHAPIDAGDEVPRPPPAPSLGLAGTGCFEAGGHSVHPVSLNPLPAPWQPADVLGDVGDQLLYSEIPDPQHPTPTPGHTMGNYHATVVCDSWSFNGTPRPGMVFGFVGMKVETPPFSGPGPTHEYLVTVVASSDADVRAALAVGGIQAMTATANIDLLPEDTLDIRMATDHNGAYQSTFQRLDMGPLHAPWVRLWFQHDDRNGTFSPLALDMRSEGGTHFAADGQGYFSHTGTDHHWPLPGAYGQTAALGYDGFDRTFSWGPRPNVTLDAAYVH